MRLRSFGSFVALLAVAGCVYPRLSITPSQPISTPAEAFILEHGIPNPGVPDRENVRSDGSLRLDKYVTNQLKWMIDDAMRRDIRRDGPYALVNRARANSAWQTCKDYRRLRYRFFWGDTYAGCRFKDERKSATGPAAAPEIVWSPELRDALKQLGFECKLEEESCAARLRYTSELSSDGKINSKQSNGIGISVRSDREGELTFWVLP